MTIRELIYELQRIESGLDDYHASLPVMKEVEYTNSDTELVDWEYKPINSVDKLSHIPNLVIR